MASMVMWSSSTRSRVFGSAMRGEKMAAHDTVRIVAHDEEWAARCAGEAEAIRAVIAPARAFIDHVGSTAIRGLMGKPCIDLLVSLLDWSEAQQVAATLKTAGYVEEESCDNPPRIFLVKPDPVTPFHLHLVPNGNSWGQDMIVFRDELSGDPDLASRYAALKQRLAQAYPTDAKAYTRGKSSFVAEVLRHAAAAFSNDRLLTPSACGAEPCAGIRTWHLPPNLVLRPSPQSQSIPVTTPPFSTSRSSASGLPAFGSCWAAGSGSTARLATKRAGRCSWRAVSMH
ncbi:MAG: GrpB family protein, partial [Mesorhizobium sp.]